jgi:hypothetical protein
MRDIGLKLGFITSVIVRRNTFFANDEKTYEEYSEYGFAFVYAIYHGIYRAANVYIVSDPIVHQRGGNSSGDKHTWYKYFVVGSALILERLKNEGYSGSAIYWAKNNIVKEYVFHDLSMRRRSGEDVRDVQKMIFDRYRYNYNYWLWCLPVAILPRIILVAMNKAVNYVREYKRGF